MKGRIFFVVVLAAALGCSAGCCTDPIGTYRIGESLDVEAFGREHGEEDVRTVRLDQERYSYRQCTIYGRSDTCFIDVSADGRIVGLTVWKPCGVDDLVKTTQQLESRLSAPYADGKGGLRDGVEVRTRYEPGSKRVVATCHAPAHAAAVQSFLKRTTKPRR